mmetsp:Transcript_122594/g.352215  ORF Transcript_122594/g.352215 Transcript_122594/m.352215 type:complete len:124 (+) Transcript_122594:144-515(+)
MVRTVFTVSATGIVTPGIISVDCNIVEHRNLNAMAIHVIRCSAGMTRSIFFRGTTEWYVRCQSIQHDTIGISFGGKRRFHGGGLHMGFDERIHQRRSNSTIGESGRNERVPTRTIFPRKNQKS